MSVDREDVAQALPDRYVLARRLGAGGFSDVFQAFDRVRATDVAVKAIAVVDEEMRRRARAEARVLGQLRHPNLVRILQVLETDRLCLLVMEYVAGQTLAKMTRPVALETVCALGLAVAQALDYIHGERLLHRDLKPANLMLTDDGVVKVLDFGIALLMEHESVRGVTGTPAWMAPEQRAFEVLGPATDVYCLALVLQWLLGGTAPLRALPAPADLAGNDAILGVLRRALSQNSADRQSSAREFAADLAAAADGTLGPDWLARTGVSHHLDDVVVGPQGRHDDEQLTLRRATPVRPAGHPPIDDHDAHAEPPAPDGAGGAVPSVTAPPVERVPRRGPGPRRAIPLTRLRHLAIALASTTIVIVAVWSVLVHPRRQTPGTAPPRAARAAAATASAPARTTRASAPAPTPARPPLVRLAMPANLSVTALAFSPDGAVLAAATSQDLRLWDTARPAAPTLLSVTPLVSQPSRMSQVVFSRTGTALATVSGDRQLRLWDVGDRAHPTLRGQFTSGSNILAAAFSPDGTAVLAVDTTSLYRLKIDDASRGQPVGQRLPGTTEATTAAFSPEGSVLAVGSATAPTQLVDLTDPTRPAQRGQARVPEGFQYVPAAVSADQTMLATIIPLAGGIQLWNITDRHMATQVGPPFSGEGFFAGAGHLSFARDGTLLAAVNGDSDVQLWDLRTISQPLREALRISGHHRVNAIALSPDSKIISTGGDGGVLRLWRTGR